jgi:hypothetical protein
MTSDHFFLPAATFRIDRVILYYPHLPLTMKAKLPFLLVLALAAISQFASTLLAQPPGERSPRQIRMERRARWATLTEAERSKLRAAHQKALADPEVKAAREKLKQARHEFREVMHPAMLKADPSIQPILERLRAERTAGE